MVPRGLFARAVQGWGRFSPLIELEDLAARWRQEAEIFHKRGAEQQATMLESCAEDLTEGLRSWRFAALSLPEAASESGLSYSHLQRQVSRGEIPNAGCSGAPLILRKDLPQLVPSRSNEDPLVDEALQLRA